MYRLLVVDDEPAIVEGIAQLFQELELGLDICKAYSAVEAVGSIRRMKIDIVISDIRMPEKSGLQLLDDLVYYWPSCKIILLTGYDEFDYVYSAIRKNVNHYILKTEDDEVLIQAVKQCLAQIQEEAASFTMMEAAKNQMALMGPLLQKELFEALLHGEDLAGLLIDEQLERLAVKLDRRLPVLLLVCRADCWEENTTLGSKLNVYFSIQHLVEERLVQSVCSESFVYKHAMIVWLIQPSPGEGRFIAADGEIDWRGLSSYLKGVLVSVQDDCRKREGPGISFVISGKAVQWNGMHDEFDQICSYMKRQLAAGRTMAVVDLGMPEGIWTAHAGESAAIMHCFKKNIKLLEMSLAGEAEVQFEVICRELIEEIQNEFDSHYSVGAEKYYSFLLVFLNEMNTLNIEQLSIMDIPVDWEAAVDAFVRLGQWINRKKQEQREQDGDMLIRRTQQYIHQNISNDLSLVRIADAMFFNPSYLSRIYKQHTGSNLSDYIHSVKLGKAQQLLEDPALKVNEISEELGFNSPSYFSTFFRKMTGKTPQEFREEIIDSGGIERK